MVGSRILLSLSPGVALGLRLITLHFESGPIGGNVRHHGVSTMNTGQGTQVYGENQLNLGSPWQFEFCALQKHPGRTHVGGLAAMDRLAGHRNIYLGAGSVPHV